MHTSMFLFLVGIEEKENEALKELIIDRLLDALRPTDTTIRVWREKSIAWLSTFYVEVCSSIGTEEDRCDHIRDMIALSEKEIVSWVRDTEDVIF